jgi:nicotinate-nucleotide pyrophosphorylase (carboxylating)
LVIEPLVRAALLEDLGRAGDVTTDSIIAADARATVQLVSRESGVVAGLPLAVLAWRLVDPRITVEVHLPDGSRVEPGSVIATACGPARGLLTGERVALNFLGHLSGVATGTATIADAIAHTHAQVADTRKTIPGLRALQKYAVRCGGGVNHRLGLGDAVLVKDNHVVAAGGVLPALAAVRERFPDLPCEVEVDSLEQLDQMLDAGVNLVLLDNFPVWQTQIAVQRRDKVSPATRLESSGGLTLDAAADYARCGVEFLAVGGLTHSVAVLDLGLDM